MNAATPAGRRRDHVSILAAPRSTVNGAIRTMMHEVHNANGGGGQMGERTKPDWTFLTNHSHVLVCIAEEPDVRGRDIAERVGITERAAQSIIGDLVDAGYVIRTREGRRNRYTINADGHLRHPLQEDHTVGELLVALGRLRPRRRRTA